MQQGDGGQAVEIAIFKLKEGITRDQLLATSDAVSEWVKRQPGFISRDLTYSAESDSWIDLIWWESLAAARAAAEVAMTSESCAPMFAAIDLAESQMVHGVRAVEPVTGGARVA